MAIRNPAEGRGKKQYFRQKRNCLRIRPKYYFSLGAPAGMRIATPVCALARNDMQKTGRCAQVQGGFPAVHRQYPGIMRTRCKFFACHCEERSDGTIRNPAEIGKNKQHFGQIRKLVCPPFQANRENTFVSLRPVGGRPAGHFPLPTPASGAGLGLRRPGR